MASTLTNLTFKRFTRQTVTESLAILATEASAKAAADALLTAPWVDVDDTESNFPPRNAVQTGSQPTYDAYKYCGDYLMGNQKAYAGAVAYRFTIPQDAIDASADVTSIDVSVLVDRWLVDGIHLAATVSSSETPSADWATIRAGDVSLSAQLPILDPRAEQADALTLTFPASTAALAYLWVYLTLEDYESFRGFWIEGGALVVGPECEVVVSADYIQDLQTPVIPERYYNPYLYCPLTVDLKDYSLTALALEAKPDGTPRTPDLTDFAMVCSEVKEGYVGIVDTNPLMPDDYSQITIAAWIKASAAPVADIGVVLLSPDGTYATTDVLGLYVDYTAGAYKPTVKLYGKSAVAGDSFGSLATTSGATLFDGDWHRIVATYRKLAGKAIAAASELILYVDGSNAGSSSAIQNGFVTGDADGAPVDLLHLAIGPNGGAEFYSYTSDYALNDVVIDTQAWTSTEVTADYAAYRAMKPAPAKVDNLASSSVADTTATVTADMDPLNKGTVTLFYGTTDGAEVPAAWDSSDTSEGLVAEERGDAISIDLTGLTAETQYFFRIRTVNEYGTFWSAVDDFTTTA